MSEPKRLIDGDHASQLLVASMQGESLSADAKLRMRAALGLGVGAAAVASAGKVGATKSLVTATAGKSLSVGAVKWIGLLALGGASVAGAWAVGRTATPPPASVGATTSSPGASPSSESSETTAAAMDAPSTSTPLPSHAPEEPRQNEAARSAPGKLEGHPSNAIEAKSADKLNRSASAARPRAAQSAAAHVAGDVTEELRLLEIARSRLRGGDAAGGLSSLERYRQGAPNGVLRVEADVLEIEALTALGRRDEAVKKGRAILVRHPEGPLSERVRRLIGG